MQWGLNQWGSYEALPWEDTWHIRLASLRFHFSPNDLEQVFLTFCHFVSIFNPECFGIIGYMIVLLTGCLETNNRQIADRCAKEYCKMSSSVCCTEMGLLVPFQRRLYLICTEIRHSCTSCMVYNLLYFTFLQMNTCLPRIPGASPWNNV